MQKQVLLHNENICSMNYLLTSTCFENTYSHQNPEFVNALLQRYDSFYNVLYSKDGANLIKCVERSIIADAIVVSPNTSPYFENG